MIVIHKYEYLNVVNVEIKHGLKNSKIFIQPNINSLNNSIMFSIYLDETKVSVTDLNDGTTVSTSNPLHILQLVRDIKTLIRNIPSEKEPIHAVKLPGAYDKEVAASITNTANTNMQKLIEFFKSQGVNDVSANTLTIGDWDCPHSVTGLCVYNHRDDPCLDSCLICGQADERK
jgi:Tfp pilus assembly PilM family ATPase